MPAGRRNFRIFLFSTVVGIIAGALTLPIFSLIMWFLQLPITFGEGFALTAFGVACLAGGFAAGKLKRHYGLLNGLKAGFLLFLMLVAVSFVLGSLTGEFFIGRLTVTVICGSAGGVLGVNKISY